VADRLRGAWGRPLRVFAEVGSTQDEALEWARSGAPEGALVVADRQTAGRGRAGRPWLSPPGRSLYLSLVLRPGRQIVPGVLTTAVGLAAAEAIEELHGLPTRLKWPNDVVVEGRKIAGVLVETVVSGGEMTAAAAGVGINVSWEARTFPGELAGRATSISQELQRRGLELGHRRVELLAALLERAASLYRLASSSSSDVIVQRAAARSDVLGRRVVVRLAGGGTKEGMATRLLATGALEIETAEGKDVLSSGEVERLRTG
jgi:BirA family transcriptional regulator, biotin operon repressor / biotin---[acetyl-CoA-carboxylase] ligase